MYKLFTNNNVYQKQVESFYYSFYSLSMFMIFEINYDSTSNIIKITITKIIKMIRVIILLLLLIIIISLFVFCLKLLLCKLLVVNIIDVTNCSFELMEVTCEQINIGYSLQQIPVACYFSSYEFSL